MGRGTRYPHVEALLRRHYAGGRVLELGAGGAVYRDMFTDYVASDLPTTPYARPGDLDVCCDARQLPFAAGSFALCFAVASLYMMPDPGNVFREVHRCLADGGVFLAFDYSRATQEVLAERHRRQNDSVHLNLWTARELTDLLRDAGFAAIERLETKVRWKALVTMWPSFGDRYRPWLMIAAHKSRERIH